MLVRTLCGPMPKLSVFFSVVQKDPVEVRPKGRDGLRHRLAVSQARGPRTWCASPDAGQQFDHETTALVGVLSQCSHELGGGRVVHEPGQRLVEGREVAHVDEEAGRAWS